MDEIEEVDEVIIPLYRARKSNSTEYVIGYLTKKTYNNQKVRFFILEDKEDEIAMNWEIDISTIAINCNRKDMIDLNGNMMFASLGNICGDIITYNNYDFHLEYDGKYYTLCDELSVSDLNDFGDFCQFKIKGIKE